MSSNVHTYSINNDMVPGELLAMVKKTLYCEANTILYFMKFETVLYQQKIIYTICAK